MLSSALAEQLRRTCLGLRSRRFRLPVCSTVALEQTAVSRTAELNYLLLERVVHVVTNHHRIGGSVMK